VSEDFLSQEEIDALLGGGEEKKEEEDKSPVKPFDFSKVEHIKKGGLPGLQFIFTKWTKLFREEIRSLIPQINMVSVNDIYITRFNDFMLKIPLPASYTIISMKPLKENSLLVLDSRLVFTVISVLFGGPPKPFKVEGREFTKLELRIVKDFINRILQTFEKVWEPIFPIKVEMKSIELNPNLARIVSPSEKVIIVELSVDIDGFESPFFFCFPQSTFLPIKDFIYSEIAQIEEDIAWKSLLLEKLRKTNVYMWVELLKTKYKVRDILSWKEGTTLETEVSTENLLSVYVQDKPKFLGKLGKLKNKFAVRIEKVLKEEENE